MTLGDNKHDETLIEETKNLITKYSVRAYERKLTAAAGGNVSARIGNSEQFLITATGLSLGDTRPDNIIMIDIEGKKIGGPEGFLPSKETGMHLAVYKRYPAVGGVVHVHPNFCNVWAAKGSGILHPTITAKAKLGQTPWVDPAGAGSEALRNSVDEVLSNINDDSVHTILLRRHGTISFGPNVIEAFLRVDLAEEQAKLAYFLELASVKVAFES